MKGATLIVIRLVDRKMMKMEREDKGLQRCFEEEEKEALREVVRKMLNEKKPYKMEMDSL